MAWSAIDPLGSIPDNFCTISPLDGKLSGFQDGEPPAEELEIASSIIKLNSRNKELGVRQVSGPFIYKYVFKN